jgi:hypothetical protein
LLLGRCDNSQRYHINNFGNHIASRSYRYIFEETASSIDIQKRKANNTMAMVVNGRVGTRTEDFLTYIFYVTDVG